MLKCSKTDTSQQESLIPVTDLIMNLPGGSILKAKIDAIKNPTVPTDKKDEGKTNEGKTGTSKTSLPVKPRAHVQPGKKEKPDPPVKPDTAPESDKTTITSPVIPVTPRPAVTEKTGTTAPPPKVQTVKSKVSVSLKEGSRYLSGTNELGKAST